MRSRFVPNASLGPLLSFKIHSHDASAGLGARAARLGFRTGLASIAVFAGLQVGVVAYAAPVAAQSTHSVSSAMITKSPTADSKPPTTDGPTRAVDTTPQTPGPKPSPVLNVLTTQALLKTQAVPTPSAAEKQAFGDARQAANAAKKK